MRSRDELIKLIRDSKHEPFHDVELSLRMCQPDTALTTDWDTIVTANLDCAHFSADKETIIAQANAAAQLARFARFVAKKHIKYVARLEKIYGPLMEKLVGQLTKAYLAEPTDVFAMQENIDAIDQLAEEIALREESEEAIFDGKRIDADLKDLENGDDDRQ